MKKKKNKILNITDVLVVAFGAMIGWGWVVSSGSWINSGGVLGTILGFVIGGTMIFFVGLVYSELTPAMPNEGGEKGFALKAFGPTGSFVCSWALVLSYIGVVCYEAVSLPTILQYIFPKMMVGYMYTIAGFDVYASWLAISVGFSILITTINFIGLKKAAVLQKILTIVIAIVGVALFVASLFAGDISNVGSQLFVGEGGGVFNNILKIAMVAPFFLFGFDVIPQTSDEINIPLKKIGRIMLLSIILAVAFYSMVVFGIGLVFDNNEIVNSMNASGLVTADAMAKAFNSSVMAKIMIIGGLCGIVTSWNSFLIGGSRLIYSMSESFMVPRVFYKSHNRFGTPFVSILLVGILSIISPFFGRTMLVWIVDAATFACCLAYCLVSISFLVIRKKYPDLERPFKIKHPYFVGIVATVLSFGVVVLYLIPGSGTTLVWQEWIIVGVWIMLGIIFYIWSKIRYKDEIDKSTSFKAKLDYTLKHNLFVSKVVRFLASIFMRFIGLFIGVNDKFIIFSGHNRGYNDSPKVLYEKMISMDAFNGYTFYWALDDLSVEIPGNNVIKIKSDTFKYFVTTLKCKYWVTCVNIERSLRYKKKKQIYLNTGHGITIKNCGNDAKGRNDFNFHYINLFCVSGDYEKAVYERAYKLNPNSIIETGLPRNEELFNVANDEAIAIKKKLGLPLDKKIILYAPTWRDSNDGGKTYSLKPPIDLTKWQSELGSDYILLLRTHPYTTKLLDVRFNDFVRDYSSYPIVNDLLKIADYLISDYSAIIFDYAILERPIICFAYDYVDYVKNRGLTLNLETEMPLGIKQNEDEVLAELLSKDYDAQSSATKVFKNKYIQYGKNATMECIEKLFDLQTIKKNN